MGSELMTLIYILAGVGLMTFVWLMVEVNARLRVRDDELDRLADVIEED